jgi:hypothetical protein
MIEVEASVWLSVGIGIVPLAAINAPITSHCRQMKASQRSPVT